MQSAESADDGPKPVMRHEKEVVRQDGSGHVLGKLVLSAATPLTKDRPGNGGMRLWNYSDEAAAHTEAQGLALGMEAKHATFNTGFAGAKLVCASSTPVSEWHQSDKKLLMDSAAEMLTELEGVMYTGCDMNTTVKDMDYLAEQCPYVLAAVGNPRCDPNAATAYGVLGAIEATLNGSVVGKKLVVHGCGNVGSIVAEQLVRLGAAEVKTIDADPARANVPGCTPLAADSAWWAEACDALVPCSASGLLTPERSSQLRCDAIVGATNLPFASPEAKQIAEKDRSVAFVPEGVSSAGAVVVDSIEFYAHESFTTADPAALYEFTRDAIGTKVGELVTMAAALRVPPSLVVPLVAERNPTPLGARFPAWERAQQAKQQAQRSSYGVAANSNGASSAAMDGVVSTGAGASYGMSRDFAAAALARCAPAAPVFAQMRGIQTAAARGIATKAATTTSKQPRTGRSGLISASMSASMSASSRRGLCTPAGGLSSATKADVVIAGAGIMGLNIAYQLRRRDPNLSVLVLEQANALGFGSSGYSTGFQRAYYSFDETMRFALDGMEAYKNWQDYVQDSRADAKFTETGALWMLGYDDGQNDAMVDRLASFGVAADRLDEAELAKRFPLINPEPFPTFNDEGDEVAQSHGAFSAVYEHGCGHIDSSTCLEDLARACRRDGVDLRLKQRIGSFVTDASSGRCTGVRMLDGTLIEAGVAVVNASGPWFNKLNDTVGLKLSTNALPTRIQVGHKMIPDEFCNLPFVADGWGPSGIYFMPRAANNQLVFGSVAHRFESEIVDPDNYNDALDPDVKQDYLNCLFHRLPTLPTDGEIIGFSSMYTVNQDDVHPMIGETKVAGLWACNGFSGHGFKLAPAVGSLVAQQITGQTTDRWETSVPHDFMGPYREPLTLKVKTHFA